jgi:hypothetical protein
LNKGNGSSPPITVEAGAVKFNLDDFLSIFKAMMMIIVGMRSSGVNDEGLRCILSLKKVIIIVLQNHPSTHNHLQIYQAKVNLIMSGNRLPQL